MPNATRLNVMDLRPALAAGKHPVDDVLAAADALAPNGELELVAPFEPRPLMQRLRERGCAVDSSQDGGVWLVRVAKGALLPLDELTGLEPPEPLERVLAAVSALEPNASYLARLPRNPVLLVPQLDGRGLQHEIAMRPDGTAMLWVWRPA